MHLAAALNIMFQAAAERAEKKAGFMERLSKFSAGWAPAEGQV